MEMKYIMRKVGLYFLLAASILCACANDSSQDESMQSAETQNEEASVTESAQSGSEDEHTDSDENNVNTSAEYTTAFAERQYGDSNDTFIETDAGYYYTAYADMYTYVEVLGRDALDTVYVLYYKDKENEIVLPLCNKPDCDHTNTDCISCVDGIIPETLSADDDYIYYVATEKEYSEEAEDLISRYEDGESSESLGVSQVTYYTNINLYRIKKDGTEKDAVYTMGVSLNTYYLNADSYYKEGTVEISNMFVIDGKLYYAMVVSDEVSIRVYDLSSKKENVLYSEEAEGSYHSIRLCHSGDYLWVHEEHNTETGYEANVMAIYLPEDEVKTVISDVKDARGNGLFADGDIMYYSDDEDMWMCDYSTGTKTVLYTFEAEDKTYHCPVPYEDMLIVSRMDCIEVYDREGNYITTIEFTEADVSDGGTPMQPYVTIVGIVDDVVYIKYYNIFDENIADREIYYAFDLNEALEGNATFSRVF